MIIDTNRRTTAKLDCLHSEGVRSIIRYYARTTSQPEKRLTRDEADAIVDSGKSIAVVHQAGGANASSFSAQKGKQDAEYAFEYAIATIGQPAGSAIYFAVDFDCNQSQLDSRVIPHFEAIHEANSGAFSKSFAIGAYGNGLVLEALLDRGLAAFAWLSQSTGHHGSKDFKKTDRWTLFQHLSSTLCGIGVDVDDLNPNASHFGQFSSLDDAQPALAADAALAVPLPAGPSYRVIAGPGLRLRSGPGTDFEIVTLLAAGSVVREIQRFGDWVIVDTNADGQADGAVHAGFLSPVA
jgi:hypothetical protein